MEAVPSFLKGVSFRIPSAPRFIVEAPVVSLLNQFEAVCSFPATHGEFSGPRELRKAHRRGPNSLPYRNGKANFGWRLRPHRLGAASCVNRLPESGLKELGTWGSVRDTYSDGLQHVEKSQMLAAALQFLRTRHCISPGRKSHTCGRIREF